MPEKILVTPQKLDDAAGKIENLAGEYQKQYTMLYQKTGDLKTTWNGKDNVAYINQIDGFKDDFDKMQNLMKQYADFLRKSAAAYRKTQDDITNQATKLRN